MFNKLREKTGKQFIKKFKTPAGKLTQEQLNILAKIEQDASDAEDAYWNNLNNTSDTSVQAVESAINTGDLIAARQQALTDATNMSNSNLGIANASEQSDAELRAAKQAERNAKFKAGLGGTADGTMGSAVGNFASGNWKTGLVDTAMAGIKAVNDLTMGDKNFGAQSEAIDQAVHGVSSVLMKSGNPYAMVAGAALEGANFLTKAGGQTVQGFDVDINSSGYGDLGHMESSSSRDFGAMIGLGGIFGQKRLQRKLQKRNEQALMAMNAANIAEDQAFEQEARMNSIQNTIMNNQMALAGGLDTSLLGG